MIWLWIGFIAFVLFMLALDLGVFNRTPHAVSAKEAMRWVAAFVSLALLFNVAVYFIYKHNWLGIGDDFRQSMSESSAKPSHDHAPPPSGPPATSAGAIDAPIDAPSQPAKVLTDSEVGLEAATMFFMGWLTEYSLSVDNIFVIALIFSFFKIPAKFQHRVLFWGILGALIMRAIMILLGVALVERFEWVLYIFGVFLIITAIKMVSGGENDFDPEKSRTVRLVRRFFPVSPNLDGQKFFTRIDGKLAMTPLFLVLIIVEVTDVVFAVDSIPAIIGITRDEFLVFTSNVFAILGLRSLYFALANLMDKFHYLKYSLAAILAFVGVKMLLEGVDFHVPTLASLGVIVGALTAGVVASLIFAAKHSPSSPHAPAPPTPLGHGSPPASADTDHAPGS